MGSIERRLRALEDRARFPALPPSFPQKNLELYFALDPARGAKLGPAPRPQPYTEEDFEEDMRAIGWLRADPGWSTELGQRFLDEWEQASKEGLEKGTQA